tara:strand:+ start:550 stop:1032 length:483 start_codon:yes stop_codon:yes gene_type:complete
MSKKLNPLWDEFIIWSFASEAERGAVSTEIDWAASKGVADRTLRRWKDHPDFIARKEQLAAVTRVTRVADAVEGEVTSADEGDYQVVKATLMEGAKNGNPKFLDMYFRTYGKPFVEEEAAARASTFAGEDLSAIVAETLVLLGEDLVAEALRSAGWKVER